MKLKERKKDYLNEEGKRKGEKEVNSKKQKK